MRTLKVNTPSKSYDIFIDNGLIQRLGIEIRKTHNGNRIAVITDENLNEQYGTDLKKRLEDSDFDIKLIIIKPGEESKSFHVLQYVYSELVKFNITRKDLIIAFGGGVVGDLGGFAAATFLRGVKLIQIPTSLLAQVDSSIGGKVAVDLPEGKNLAGAFYQPEAVFIDPSLLRTLPMEYLQDGLAEVIKYGAIRDRQLFHRLLKYKDYDELMDEMEYIIYTCCSIKRDIVERDEKDTGERMILNFGHTIGHVIEKYFNFKDYTHGRAIAVGMYNISFRGERQGYTKEGTSRLIKDILEKYSLPYRMPIMDEKEVIGIISTDKKNEGGFTNFIFLYEIGSAYIKPVEKSKIKRLLFLGGI